MFTIIGIILIAIISFICVAPIAMPIAACTMDGKPNKAQYFWKVTLWSWGGVFGFCFMIFGLFFIIPDIILFLYTLGS